MDSPYLLLVDDDPDLGLAVGVLSRRAGLRLTRQSSVESAWRAVHAERPDLVLLDMNLPGPSGLEFLRRVQQTPELPTLPVALFCQSGLKGDIASGWAAGARYCLVKDLVTQPALWQARVKEILAHIRGQAMVDSLAWMQGVRSALSVTWGEVLRRALSQTTLSCLKVELAQAMLRRALVGVFGKAASRLGLQKETGRVVLLLPREASGEQVRRVFFSIADQLWCLFGTEAATAFTQVLRAEWNRASGS